jgi:hypothetical protein
MYVRQQDSCGKKVAKRLVPAALALGTVAGTAYGWVTKWGRGAPQQISTPVPNEEAITAYLGFLNQNVTVVRTGISYLMGRFLSEVLDYERRNGIRPYSQIFNPYRNGTIPGEMVMAQNATLSQAAGTPLIHNSTIAGAAGSIAVGAGVGIGAVAGVIALCAIGYGSYQLYRYCRPANREQLPIMDMEDYELGLDYGARSPSPNNAELGDGFSEDDNPPIPPPRSRSPSPASRRAGRLVIAQQPPAHSSSSDSESDFHPPISGSDSDSD